MHGRTGLPGNLNNPEKSVWPIKIHCAGGPEKAEQIAASGTELLKQFNATLQLARERAYYGLKTDASLPDDNSWSSEEDDDKGPILKPTVRQRRRRRVESLMKCSVER